MSFFVGFNPGRRLDDSPLPRAINISSLQDFRLVGSPITVMAVPPFEGCGLRPSGWRIFPRFPDGETVSRRAGTKPCHALPRRGHRRGASEVLVEIGARGGNPWATDD